MTDTRESSVTSKTDLDDSQQKDAIDSNRRNASGYSWWKWRRSTDSVDKKSPPKEIESRQSAERLDEMKEVINDLDSLTIVDSKDIEPNVIEELVEPEEAIAHNQSIDDPAAKNDDSISSELADISKSSFSNEKYRKTLRLTSDQIVKLNIHKST